MQVKRQNWLHILFGYVLIFFGNMSVSPADTYPSKPIRVIIPLSAGSIADIALRNLANFAQEKFNQTWVVESRPGGNMVPGTDACAKSPPDGYTICFVASAGLSFAPHMMSAVPYDSVKSFKAIANVLYVIEAFAISGSIQANSVEEFKTLAVANSGKYNFGTLGSAATNELFRRWLEDEWKAKTVAIPYKGGGEIAVGFLQNNIEVSRIGIGNLTAHIASGKVKLLAQSMRSPLLPKVPTFDEVGFGSYGGGRGWWGLVAPAGTPDDIVQTLSRVVSSALQDPKYRQFLIDSYLDPATEVTPQAFGDLIKFDYERVGQTIRKYNLSAK